MLILLNSVGVPVNQLFPEGTDIDKIRYLSRFFLATWRFWHCFRIYWKHMAIFSSQVMRKRLDSVSLLYCLTLRYVYLPHRFCKKFGITLSFSVILALTHDCEN